jgi:hypothetical protein
MTFLYWARYGFLIVAAFVVAALVYAHIKTIRSR